MYLPAHFAQNDPAIVAELMRRHPFATLVTVDDDGQPFASHLPFLVDAEPLRLSAHVARANPQWRHLGRDALVIFHGPHAYVSPTWYQELPADARVPTWNYAVVHARGRARLLDEEGTGALVARLSAEHDPAWTPDLAAPSRRAMLRAIVGFTFDAPRVEGKLKLSQNRAPADRERVRAALAGAGHDDVAALMR